MSTPPAASVVIPARNAGSTLGRQLEALAHQVYPGEWEVIVVDNASTDDTTVVALEWAARLPALRVLTCEEPGSSAARNVGIEAAKGEYILLCDADDIVQPGWITALVTSFAEGHDAVAGEIDESMNDPDVMSWGPRYPRGLPPTARFLPRGITANLALKTSVARKLGGFNLAYEYGGPDTEFCWRLQLAGYRLGYCADARVSYIRKDTVRRMARKAYRTGRARAQLFADFAAAGMPRSNPLFAVARWGLLLVSSPSVLVSSKLRARWVRRAALAAGRLVGSWHFRTLYL